VLPHTRRTEVIGSAADGDDENVVADLVFLGDLPAFFVDERPDLDNAAGAVEAGHFADPINEAVPVGEREIVDGRSA
jgi:hypothetical protein